MSSSYYLVASPQTTSYITVSLLMLALSRRRFFVYGRCLRGQKWDGLEQPRWLEGVLLFSEVGMILILNLDGPDSWTGNSCRLPGRFRSGRVPLRGLLLRNVQIYVPATTALGFSNVRLVASRAWRKLITQVFARRFLCLPILARDHSKVF